MTPDTEPATPVATARKKPQLSFLLATWFGLGYLPKAPGTWGSFAGVIFLALIEIGVITVGLKFPPIWLEATSSPLELLIPASCVVVAVVGVWSSSRVAAFTGGKDPQFIVIDEVSGQMLTLYFGSLLGNASSGNTFFTPLHIFGWDFDWWVALAGLILFRLFDIWKPWPIRRLEKLPGGWGIMADDWLAGIYAAILLRVALHFNLL